MHTKSGKTKTLTIFQAQIEIHTAYGSSKDISVYQSVGLRPTQIYIVGKVSKKHHKDAVVGHHCYSLPLSPSLSLCFSISVYSSIPLSLSLINGHIVEHLLHNRVSSIFQEYALEK